jgi:serine phosphatase RsbU (regulator of sigma subunit)/CheY-like chemotaxis protein
MRILVAWDNDAEAELFALYLNNADNESLRVETPQSALAKAGEGDWDILLMSLTFPDSAEAGFALFDQLRQQRPEMPVVLGCRQTEMRSLPKFMLHGLRFHFVRDDSGDFMFLVLTCLESALEAVRAEESRKLAEKLREEMDGVRRLQESIIPKGLVAPRGYRIVARYEPAQMTVVGGQSVVLAGGDYYDLFCPDERTLIVILGDAAGHGLKACMSIMTMHTLIRMFNGDQYRDTARLVCEVNNRLCENSIVQSGGGFITLFYAAIDTAAHTMTWTSAGHPLAILQDMETNLVSNIGTDADGGLPLGISAGVEYTAGVAHLPPNSRLLFYTDGLTDAFAEDQSNYTAFGLLGIQDALRNSRGGALEGALEKLFKDSEAITRGAGRHDDTSAVLLERAPA